MKYAWEQNVTSQEVFGGSGQRPVANVVQRKNGKWCVWFPARVTASVSFATQEEAVAYANARGCAANIII